jgi:YaiO family outer membrane protein
MKNRYCPQLILAFILSSTQLYAQDSLKSTVQLNYNYNHFDRQFAQDWQQGSVEYKRQLRIGAVLGRMSYADRFSKKGWQAEAEAYPKLSKKIYAYLGVGYSPDLPVFSKFRSGTSLYLSLPKAWEIEGGTRVLYFEKAVWVLVGGISKYAGHWLLNVRSFISPGASSIDRSYFASGRYYFSSKNSYAWIEVGTGISPDENRSVQLNDGDQLTTRRISSGIKYFTGKTMVLTVSIGYSHDEFLPDTYGHELFGSLGFGVLF